ncbi:MAG: hypothetical protein JWM80_491 [Cyanobacteria bacterium RYN_339]|nr:hypothetical protein [Cyanobacteria bacterium RYN_339]
MHASRMVATLMLATLVGCSVSTPTTSSSTKPTASTKPKTTTTSDPVTNVVTTPVRDGHALAWVETKPAAGITATNNGGTVAYMPDPPDAQVTLKVPDTSLGARFKSLQIAYAAQGSSVVIPTQTWPLALQNVEPGPVHVVAVPIGNAVLKSIITGPTPPSLILASVKFIDELGQPLTDESGKDLVVTVNITVN